MSESPVNAAITTLAVVFATALSSCAGESEPQWTQAASLGDIGSGVGTFDVAMDAKGDAIAVWTEIADRGLGSLDYTVLAGRFTAEAGWGSLTKLGSAGRRGASEPKIAVNAEGHAVAAWREWASDRDDQTGQGVWAARYDPDAGWEDAILVGEAGYSPRVALNDDGRAVMVWTRSFDTVWVSHLDPESGWGAAARLDRDCLPNENAVGWTGFPDPSGPSAAKNPNVAMNDSGHAIAIWDDNENETGELELCDGSLSLRASEYVPGVGWNTPTKIGVPATAFGSLKAGLAVDESGRGLAGSLAGQVSGYSLGEGWSTLDLGFGSGNGRSSVAMADSGKAIVVWEAISEAPIYPDVVRAVRFSPERGWSEPETVSAPHNRSTAGDAAPKSPTILDFSGVDVAVNDAGECIVAWHQVGNPTVLPPPFSVWTNRYAPGRGWSTPAVLSTGETVDAASPRIALDAQGRGIAVWGEAQRVPDSRNPARLMWSRLE